MTTIYQSKDGRVWRITDSLVRWDIYPRCYGVIALGKEKFKTIEDVEKGIEDIIFEKNVDSLHNEYIRVKKFQKDTLRKLRRLDEIHEQATPLMTSMYATVKCLGAYRELLKKQLQELGVYFKKE